MRKIILFIFLLFSFSLVQAQNTTLQYPYPTKFLNLGDSLKIAYVDIKPSAKNKQTLLFIHGLGSYLPAWKKNIDSLSLHYRCIALDLPGYGKSSKGKHPYNMSFYARTISAFIQQLKLSQVTIIGHSMGGQIALTTSLMQPKLFQKIILIAPAGLETFTAQQAEMMKGFTTPTYIANTSDEKIRTNLDLNFYKPDTSYAFMANDRILMKNNSDFSAYCEAVSKSVVGMLDEPVINRLNEIALPTLIIFGENDTLIPNKYFNPALSTSQVGQVGKERIANSELKLIPQAGHFVCFEKASAVNRAIIDFLKR